MWSLISAILITLTIVILCAINAYQWLTLQQLKNQHVMCVDDQNLLTLYQQEYVNLVTMHNNNSTHDKNISAARLLNFISSIIPDELRLHNFTYNPTSLNLSGCALDQPSIAHFIHAVSQHQHLRAIDFTVNRTDNIHQEYLFTMTISFVISSSMQSISA